MLGGLDSGMLNSVLSLLIFIDFHDFIDLQKNKIFVDALHFEFFVSFQRFRWIHDFHELVWIFIIFGAWVLKIVMNYLLPL